MIESNGNSTDTPKEWGSPKRVEGKAENSDVGLDVVRPLLQPMTEDDVRNVLRHYPSVGGLQKLLSVSERPYSAGALVRTEVGEFFVKKRPASWRSKEDIEREHALIAHLTARGFETPKVLKNEDDESVTAAGKVYYEVFDRAKGEDRYRGCHTWTPFERAEHAYYAGKKLAEFHLATREFPLRTPRPLSPMSAQFELVKAPDLALAVQNLAAALPALAAYLKEKPWRSDIARTYGPVCEKVRGPLTEVEGWYTHGDWHANNLFFEGDQVVGVIDFHLADFSCRLYDLAVALDRNGILWLEVLSGDEGAVRYDVIEKLLKGYQELLPLSDTERRLLPDVLAIHPLDLALSNIAYYEGVEGDRKRADWAYEVYLLQHARRYQTKWGRAVRRFVAEKANTIRRRSMG